MSFLTKDQARERNEPITSYSPIAQSLYSPSMSPVVGERVRKKCFVLAKEHIPFSKYPAIHELEERHSVDLGATYKNKDSACNFVYYIAESQRKQLHASLATCHFYSISMDGWLYRQRSSRE